MGSSQLRIRSRRSGAASSIPRIRFFASVAGCINPSSGLSTLDLIEP